ncbi:MULTISPECIES: TetR/AcrR family transcriptional regulator C-terminal domain-containing protein [unclassified Rhodococcus (in: high G+C Gram-positive bacteria)]|uniref:TetR/AcrR family transcriptional regulator C-terminal domain-containing protein n=1 Tax=unclassified Rhodococcus (in: high G+C Gram-positive bacteria) TaxID=192944 RepID=UPI00146D7045|nr:TetR/AcrR family transcriptional regulator C-terminal domain-containing protein [Rhodococcus sp. (in: high G+C Gram-positive bacteria)]MBF0661536.1 TetR/AcrR family transcriptional regulator C-terminal domain-containing protein [Rhodococcus sp. (in: high G+C Gram-positive bacteria)]NMD94795.1 TetR family transcriptional regulator [Rhodococcus sp. BL-253-APC-6A1W]NME81050.1 TetR family transcriptional regulator [Rhodococcus sp. 105337]
MQLRRGDVLDGAMAILDEYGLGDLTMRKLATSLGVQPGALYWHFPNKQTLLGAMADRILDGVDAEPDSPDWDDALTELAHRLRSALLAHRDGAELVASTYASRLTTSRARDAFVAAAQRGGLSRAHAELAGYALLHYVLGHTVDEQSRAQLAELGALTRGPVSPDVATETAPTSDDDLLDGDPAIRFDFGLTLFVDGIRRRLNTRATS